MIGLVIALMMSCAEPDGGTCVQEVAVGPFNVSQVWPGGGGTGMYTTRLWQAPGSPGVGCVMLTTYISVCSCFSVSPLLSGGNGGSLCFYNGNHRAFMWTDWQAMHPSADDDGEIGWEQYRWKRVSTYEHVIAPRTLTCSPQIDGGCFTNDAPRGSNIRFTCPGPGICEWAPGHEYLNNVWWSSLDGMQTCVMNMSEYPLLVRDVDGDVELDGDWLGNQWSSLCFERVVDRWVEKSRRP